MNYLGNPQLRLFVGATMISFSPVWVKLVSVSPTTSGFYRVLIGGIALSLFLLVTRQRLQLTNFQVFFMMAAGVLLLGQKPRLVQVIAVPLALVGLGMIVGFDWQSLPADYRLGVILGLLTAVAYAGYMLTMRVARTGSPHRLPTREVAIVSLGSAAILGVSALTEGVSLAVPTATDAAWLLAYGLVSHCLGLLFIASSLPKVSTTEAGLALLLQPTLSFAWDVLFFARPLTATELVGAAIALLAIYMGSRQLSKQV